MTIRETKKIQNKEEEKQDNRQNKKLFWYFQKWNNIFIGTKYNWTIIIYRNYGCSSTQKSKINFIHNVDISIVGSKQISLTE